MIGTITEKNLKKYVGRQIWIEREGIKGNFRYPDGRIREGRLFGILKIDREGFYVEMFQSRCKNKDGILFDKTSFLEEPYRLQDRDIINIYPILERVVRFSNLEAE